MHAIDWNQITGFNWDDGNQDKNAGAHGVSQGEAEAVFSNTPLLIAVDARHTGAESRWHALGHTGYGRRLHITFTLRAGGTLIRIISARDMSRKERNLYAHEETT